MESEQKNWWQRLMERMKGDETPDASDLPAVGSDGLIVEPVETESDPPEKTTGLSRWAKRDSTIAQLQEGYERVNQLMVDMQKHMAEQSQRTERMCGAIEQLVRVMEDAPEISREQTRTLETIAGQLEAANSASQQLNEVVSEIPQVTRAQTEALAGVGRRLDMMNEQSVVGNQTMEKLQSAVATVGQSGQIQTSLLKQLDARASEQNQQFGELIAGQSRRFTVLVIVAIVLAVAAIAASFLAIRMR